MRLTISGIDKVNKYLINLPKNLDKNLSQTNQGFMSSVKKSARLRLARHKVTGELSASIKLLPTKTKGKTKQFRLVVDSPYALPVEEGYKGHWVSALTPTRNSAGTIGDVYNFSGFMWIKPSSGLHFLRNAIEKNLSTFSQKLDKSVGRAIKK